VRGTPADRYEATIRRTAYGIPHITARDSGSLGFGEGYAFAQDHLCSLADAIVAARGERAKFFGPGDNDVHLRSDISMKVLGIADLAANDVKLAPADQRERLIGYAAGYNALLAEVGVDQIGGWCRGAAWVRQITAEDVAARLRAVIVGAYTRGIATAAPPGSAGVVPPRDLPDVPAGLSNGWAIGKTRSENGGGLLLANPHALWTGTRRFWEKHLTIPGRLDVYGVNALGLPGVAIGFNRHIAWTHTSSAGMQFTGYALKLVPGSPTTYVYDGQHRRMATRSVEIDVRQADGSLKRVTHTAYFSHHGPIINLPVLPWTTSRAIAVRDANTDNNEVLTTVDALASAASLDDARRALGVGGIPSLNTIVATADGRAFYIDASSTPYLSESARKWWTTQMELEGDVRTAFSAVRLMLLDGSDSTFEWVNDSRARDSGVVPAAIAPQLERADYVFNANDSYWTSHATVRLTGFSPAHGREGRVRSLRTRMNARLLDDTSADGPSGPDGRFSIDEVWAAAFSNRAMSVELLRGGVVERCRATSSVTVGDATVSLADACNVLSAWDGRFNLESRGAVLWREFMTQIRPADRPRLYATRFDPADPLSTPRGLAPAPDGNDMALAALGRAVQVLGRAQLPLDVPLGQVQVAQRGNRQIAVHGGLGGEEGVVNFVGQSSNSTTLEPDPSVAPLVPGSRYLRRDGYPINSGTSFVLAVAFTDGGPRARAVLTYGQSGDPQSPHFSDQTELFSRKGWRDVLFTEKEIASDKALQTQVVTGARAAVGTAPAAPRFEAAKCPFEADAKVLEQVRCGYLTVPENRAAPDRRRLRLAVAIVKSLSPSPRPDPIVFLGGGPGDKVVARVPGLVTNGTLDTLRADRDLILYDQRGVGFSEPVFCPEAIAQFTGVFESPAARRAHQAQVLARCGDAMRRAGYDLSQYNSIASAHDLQDLRRALGHQQWNLRGGSYGTRLALVAMRVAPDGIRSAVLEGPAPPNRAKRLNMPGDFSDVVKRVSAACAAQPACNAAFPDVEQTFWQTLKVLEREPLNREVTGRNGVKRTIAVTAEGFAAAVNTAIQRQLAAVPLFVHAMRTRNDAALTAVQQALVPGAGAAAFGANPGFAATVECFEEAPLNTVSLRQRMRSLYAPVLTDGGVFSDMSQCEGLHPFRATQQDLALVRSAIPVLILTGEFDVQTHRSNGAIVKRALKHSQLVDIPGAMHHKGLNYECTRVMMRNFYNAPMQKVDESCLESIPRLRFVTDIAELKK
jgi:acyl-homoserine-lactone acylase